MNTLTILGFLLLICGFAVQAVFTRRVQTAGDSERDKRSRAASVVMVAALVGLIGNFFILKGQVDRATGLTNSLQKLAHDTERDTGVLKAQAKETLENVAQMENVARMTLTEARTLQQQAVALNRHIEQTITGGDSFAYLEFGDGGGGQIFPIVIHSGSFPVYDVKIRLIDLDEPKEDKWVLREYDLGTVGKGSQRLLDPFSLPRAMALFRFRVDIRARNGLFEEFVHGRKLNKTWRFASTLRPFGSVQVLAEEIPEGFPRTADGKYDWSTEE